MNKCLLVALMATYTLSSSASAQTNLEDNLKAVMVLFDKSRKESEAKIVELTRANEELATFNEQLISDMSRLESQVATLQKENLLLRSKISEVAVNEFELAALTMTTDLPVAANSAEANKSESQLNGQAPNAKSPKAEPADADNEPIPDFTPAAYKKTGGMAAGAEHLSEGTVLLVNLNTATDREVRMIPGIGPQMAKRIVENRPYSSIWDLMKLNGMGKKRIEALQVYITLE